MPRSVIVVSANPNLFGAMRAILRSDDRFVDAGELLHCDGSRAPLTNIYPTQLTREEWDGWTIDSGETPDPKAWSVLIFESPSPGWIAEVGTLLSQGSTAPMWFLDSENRAWPAGEVNPELIALS